MRNACSQLTNACKLFRLHQLVLCQSQFLESRLQLVVPFLQLFCALTHSLLQHFVLFPSHFFVELTDAQLFLTGLCRISFQLVDAVGQRDGQQHNLHNASHGHGKLDPVSLQHATSDLSEGLAGRKNHHSKNEK